MGFLGLASAALTLVGLPWWVAIGTCSAASWVGFAAFRKMYLLSPTTVLVALTAAVAGPLLALGVSEVWPFRPYAGQFIVVGDSPIVVGSLAPQQDTEGSMNVNWEVGDSVTVECETSDLERPNTRWYRVSGAPKVFLSESQLMPSIAEPPGDPPGC